MANKSLRSSTKFDNIYVNKDLTPAQRISEKNCRTERNILNSGRTEDEKELFYYGIRDGIIKKITIKKSNKSTLTKTIKASTATTSQNITQISN